MARYLHKNRFVVVEETAELLAATMVFPQPVRAAGRGSQEILTERRFMASEADIDARRRAGVCSHLNLAIFRTHCHVLNTKLCPEFSGESGHERQTNRTV